MQVETIEQRIRAKAYALGQEDGSMEGCAEEYWRKARDLVEAETAEEELARGAGGGAVGGEGAGAAGEDLPL